MPAAYATSVVIVALVAALGAIKGCKCVVVSSVVGIYDVVFAYATSAATTVADVLLVLHEFMMLLACCLRN